MIATTLLIVQTVARGISQQSKLGRISGKSEERWLVLAASADLSMFLRQPAGVSLTLR